MSTVSTVKAVHSEVLPPSLLTVSFITESEYHVKNNSVAGGTRINAASPMTRMFRTLTIYDLEKKYDPFDHILSYMIN